MHHFKIHREEVILMGEYALKDCSLTSRDFLAGAMPVKLSNLARFKRDRNGNIVSVTASSIRDMLIIPTGCPIIVE